MGESIITTSAFTLSANLLGQENKAKVDLSGQRGEGGGLSPPPLTTVKEPLLIETAQIQNSGLKMDLRG